MEEGKSTGSYELHIAATDGSKSAPQSGVAKVEVGVDGYGQQSWEKYCPEGSCGLEETWTYLPGNFSSEGPRWITVKVTDHAGNATEEEVSLEGAEEVPREAAPTGPDTTPPTITFAGSAQKAVWQGAASGKYELRMFATDGSPSAPQSGVAKIEVAVDGTTLQSWEKYCPVGSCRLMVSWPYSPGNFSGTHHYVTVTVRDHAGNVRTKKIEWDPTPPVVSASGELRSLENQYINGKGSKTLAISATDNHSGVRLLSLEDEGHGILASKTPNACVFKVLRDEECPLETSETLTVDTSKMPEGANHLRVVAEDFAGNVTYGEAWIVYVDRTPPTFAAPSEISVVRPPESAAPFVLLPDATDPLLADGSAGSGVGSYAYRYSLEGGLPTSWMTSPDPYFEVPGASAGQSITVEAYATDQVGNQGETMSASEAIPAEESGPIVSEEEEDEEEREPREEFIGRSYRTTSYPANASAAVSRVVEQPIPCDNEFNWPHPSSHKRTRVNAETRISCEGGPLGGFVRTILYENGRIVSDSGERHFNFIDGFNTHAAFANVPCIKGSKWRSFGEILKRYPANYQPPEEAENEFSPLRQFACG